MRFPARCTEHPLVCWLLVFRASALTSSLLMVGKRWERVFTSGTISHLPALSPVVPNWPEAMAGLDPGVGVRSSLCCSGPLSHLYSTLLHASLPFLLQDLGIFPSLEPPSHRVVTD